MFSDIMVAQSAAGESKAWIDLGVAAVGAFFGAAAAFLLVIATDLRRNRRAVKTMLPSLLKRARILVDRRIEGTEKALQSLKAGGHMRNTGLLFPVERIERFADQGADWLDDEQALAIDNLAFWMRESDANNRAALAFIDQMERAQLDTTRGDDSQRMLGPGLRRLIADRYNDERQLLDRILKVVDAYLANRLTEHGGAAP